VIHVAPVRNAGLYTEAPVQYISMGVLSLAGRMILFIIVLPHDPIRIIISDASAHARREQSAATVAPDDMLTPIMRKQCASIGRAAVHAEVCPSQLRLKQANDPQSHPNASPS
jgi:hypothetical protein